MLRKTLPLIALLVSTNFLSADNFWIAQGHAQEYVGSQTCFGCHQDQYQQWQTSDHFKAMEEPTENSVLGDFSNSTSNFHNVQSRFFQEQDNYFVEITESASEAETFQIKYTFGYYPLQQYLIELEDGYLQALNIAWDSRSAEEGGQRWFHLQPEENIQPDHPFHWKNHFQNWNARCAECHSTNLQKNYDQSLASYSTTWSEINVACEACHGPASEHLELAASDEYSPQQSGLVVQAQERVAWTFESGAPIATPIGSQTDQHVDMCGNCHSLRNTLTSSSVGQSYHDANRIQLLNETAYFLDGQIKEEVYVLGSFLQSKMYEQGVTCTNCHNPHSGKLLIEGNGLCAQCHQVETYDTAEHHNHSANSTGAQCVSCHMPERTYMQVDDRRDHSFTIPRPKLSMALDVPNACVSCHEDQDNQWADETLTSWGISSTEEHWATLMERAQAADLLAIEPIASTIATAGLPTLINASLLSHLAPIPSQLSTQAAWAGLQNDNPLTRRAAVEATQNLPINIKWQILSPYLQDPNRSVRFAIIENLLTNYTELTPDQQQSLGLLISEYRNILALNADSPGTQLSIAQLELNLRNLPEAELAYQASLEIEPNYVPALLNISDFYRAMGREDDVEPPLAKALAFAPESGAINHSYGLHLIRQQNYDGALPYLKAAVAQADAQPRYAYVYAVALENTGEINEAIETLQSADQQWPNQYELLVTLALYLDQSGNTENIGQYLDDLLTIAPSSPQVQQLQQKYRPE